jgi:inner membrane protein
MPTIFSHAAVPIALAVGAGRRAIPSRLLAAGAVAAMLPDLDVLSFHFGIAYGDAFGHRGATHSLFFAAVLGLVALAFAARLRATRVAAFTFVAASAASHGLLDMLTDGGSGIALFWPFSAERLFFPWQVIEVSPLGLRFFASGRALDVLASELLWVWLPAALACAVIVSVRLTQREQSAAAKAVLLSLIAALSFLFAAMERTVSGRVEPFSTFGFAEMLASLTLLFWWFHLDKAERRYRSSGLLNAAGVAFGPFALAYYFFRSRGWRSGAIATLLGIGYLAALFALSTLGEEAAARIAP